MDPRRDSATNSMQSMGQAALSEQGLFDALSTEPVFNPSTSCVSGLLTLACLTILSLPSLPRLRFSVFGCGSVLCTATRHTTVMVPKTALLDSFIRYDRPLTGLLPGENK